MNRFSKVLTEDISHGAAKAMLYGAGFKNQDFKKAQVAISSMAYDGNPCNSHLRELTDIVYNNVNDHSSKMLKGLRFNTIGVSDGITMGTKGMNYSLPSREIIADSIETMMKAHYYDANITIASCDKNLPGALIGLLRVNRPSFIIYGGSIKPGCHNNKPVDVVSAFQSYGQLLSGEITKDDRDSLLKNCCPGSGSCGGMYTANTMSSCFEAMGISLPYSSSNPAISNEKKYECETASKYIYNLLDKNITPLDIVTKKSIHNAIVTAIALGGSTNVVLHLLAIAKTAKINLKITDFNDIGKSIPVFGNLKPFGKYLMHDIYLNGGTPVILKYLLDKGYLHGDCITATGNTLEDNLKKIDKLPNKEVFCYDNPIKKDSHIRIFKGNMCELGAVGKITGKEGEYFKGLALVFDTEDEFLSYFNQNNIKNLVSGKVIIIRYQGPKGGPGMPEMLRPTSTIAGLNLQNNIAFLTDGRFSGGSHGFCIGHITPEAYNGGMIGLVENDDEIIIDAVENNITLNVSNDILSARRNKWKLPESVINRTSELGYLNKFRNTVSNASEGCVTY